MKGIAKSSSSICFEKEGIDTRKERGLQKYAKKGMEAEDF